jgi:hypothetical protein
MGRKTTFACLHAAITLGVWLLAGAVVESSAGSEIGGSVQQLGERLELHLRDKSGKTSPAAQPPPSPPSHQHDRPDALQPWERVDA